MDNYFVKLNQISVAEHIEKKGQFNYLSWPFAVQQLRQADPGATWAVVRFNGLPYLKTEAGFFVEVAVTVQGVTLSQIAITRSRCPIASTSIPASSAAW
jgi:hypothetical protein